MIQRIQSLYILISIALMACAAFFPLIGIHLADNDYIAYASGISNSTITLLETMPLLILAVSAIVIDLFTLFSFKKRLIQIRLLSFTTILKLGFYGLGAYYYFQIDTTPDYVANFKVATAFPLIATMFSYLAIRAVIKDEALVKSLDRIR